MLILPSCLRPIVLFPDSLTPGSSYLCHRTLPPPCTSRPRAPTGTPCHAPSSSASFPPTHHHLSTTPCTRGAPSTEHRAPSRSRAQARGSPQLLPPRLVEPVPVLYHSVDKRGRGRCEGTVPRVIVISLPRASGYCVYVCGAWVRGVGNVRVEETVDGAKLHAAGAVGRREVVLVHASIPRQRERGGTCPFQAQAVLRLPSFASTTCHADNSENAPKRGNEAERDEVRQIQYIGDSVNGLMKGCLGHLHDVVRQGARQGPR